ncbi:Hypothetical protein, putative [Bodo saltans]|uniref:Uncharacterized protein n=1 Tax=Bodo saltans TaxID=75058 RepID=A0A0S4JHV9_BODSA|nr:Hypothetical protein, putative [Bodo saltans]|eukprot:CUG89720.1 Hypothetical protein, putative [Bodo saltans]
MLWGDDDDDNDISRGGGGGGDAASQVPPLPFEYSIDIDQVSFDEFFDERSFATFPRRSSHFKGGDTLPPPSLAYATIHQNAAEETSAIRPFGRDYRSSSSHSSGKDDDSDDIVSLVLKANLLPQVEMQRNATTSFSWKMRNELLFSRDIPIFEDSEEAPFMEEGTTVVRVQGPTPESSPGQAPLGMSRRNHPEEHLRSLLTAEELRELSDDLDELLSRHISTTVTPRVAVDTFMESNARMGSSHVFYSDGSMIANESAPLPFSTAQELQQLLGGSIDVLESDVFGDEGDLVFALSDGPGDVDVNRRLDESISIGTCTTTPGTTARRRSSAQVLNALPLLRSSSLRRRGRRESGGDNSQPSSMTDTRRGTSLHVDNHDVVERQLVKALVALHATYLLTPRLLSAVMADEERHANNNNSNDSREVAEASLSQVALTQRLQRHLTGIMDLEAQAMHLLVQMESLRRRSK